EVRAPMERKARVRTAAVALDEARAQVLEDFNLAVLERLRECEALPTGTGTDDDSGDTGSSTGTDDTTTGPQPCLEDADCASDSARPYCDPVQGMCAACDQAPDDATADAACAALDPSVPLCVGGGCVACTSENTSVCDERLLICDEAAMACVPCTEHEQCESGVCDLLAEEPSCFDPDNAFDVGVNRRYLTITDALAAVEMMTLDRALLRLHGEGMMDHFTESVPIDFGVVAIIAADDDQPRWSNSGDMAPPILSVTGTDTRVYLDGIRLSGSQSSVSPGITCTGASIGIRRSRIVANTGGGIDATDGCVLDLQTSFVGGDANDVDAIYVEDSTLTMLYTTVGAGFGNARALTCNNPSSVTVRNSIMVSRDGGELDCSTAISISNAANTSNGGKTTSVGVLNLNWFENYATGNFLLSTSGGNNSGQQVFADIATWQTGDPTTDIEGDPRPNSDGASDHPGADVP
ncbi:MAG: hypothetical protein KDK70_19700, partial [Myxococcales bacterium]|nr:hypothetical protein [Myxococcales bacterium]